MELTPIGLGTWAHGGGGWKFGWGEQDDDDSTRVIHEAIDLGINWIDTAAIYGHGHAEEVLGKALEGKRDQVHVATKCGRVWEGDSREIGKCLRKRSVLGECENSLRRLKIDHIDLYQIHWPEPVEEIEEGWDAVSTLIDQGKVRYGGVSNFNLDHIQQVAPICPITTLQPPFSLLRRDVESEVLPYCEEQGIGVIAYSPMQAGLLTGRFSRERAAALPDNDWRGKTPCFTEPQLSVNLEAVGKLVEVADEIGITMSQLALAWVIAQPGVTAAIVGARRPEQIRETVEAGEIVLPDGMRERIGDIIATRDAAVAAL